MEVITNTALPADTDTSNADDCWRVRPISGAPIVSKNAKKALTPAPVFDKKRRREHCPRTRLLVAARIGSRWCVTYFCRICGRPKAAFFAPFRLFHPKRIKKTISMLGTQHLAAFVAAGLLLNATPGPDTMYILGRTLSQGRSAGVASVFGISTGCLVHTIAAALGLSVVLARSALAFSCIKMAGAG